MPVSGGQTVLLRQIRIQRVALSKPFEVLGEPITNSQTARLVAHGYRPPRILSFRSIISVYRPLRPIDARPVHPCLTHR